MVIVETLEEFQELRDVVNGKEITVIPLMTDLRVHPTANKLCVLSIYVDGDLYLIPFEHNEGIFGNFKIEELKPKKVITPDIKKLCHISQYLYWDLNTFVDTNSIEYFGTQFIHQPENFYTSVMKEMYQKFYNQKNINKAIPMMELVKYFELYSEHISKLYHPSLVYNQFEFKFDSVLIPLAFIEEAGLCVQSDLFKRRFPKNMQNIVHKDDKDYVYTEYNPYTITGRITNRFDGVNYAALGTKDDTREVFVSRFGDGGSLISIDYSSFHPLIIADAMGYTFPGPVYEYLAQQYYDNVNPPTDEEIKNAKLHTMQLMYDEAKPTTVDFITKMYEYRELLWNTIWQDGILNTPQNGHILLDRIEAPTKSKVFNYYIQLLEMEISMKGISEVIKWMAMTSLLSSNRKDLIRSRIVLYTYDSILIDFCHADGSDVLREMIKIMEQDGKFPVKIEQGSNYAKMRDVTKLVKKERLAVG